MGFGSDTDAEKDFGISEELVEVREQKTAGTSDLTLNDLLHPPLKLHEDLRNGNGGQAWPAGMTLAEYLLRVKREDLVGKSILELGAGGGIVSLALAHSFKYQPGSAIGPHIIMTDQPPMLDLMRTNIALNELPESLIHADVLDWGTTKWNGHPDILLAADCVYFEPAFPLLLQTMKDLMDSQTICYFCMKKRRKADMRFIKELRKAFLVVDIGDDPNEAVWKKQAIMLYKVTTRPTQAAKVDL